MYRVWHRSQVSERGTSMAEVAASPAREKFISQGDQQTSFLIDKAEVLAELAGVISHRFNNFMMAASSFAEVEMKRAASPQKRALEHVLSSINEATSLVQELLKLSRKHVPSPQPVSLNSLITGMATLLQELAGQGAGIEFSLSSNIRLIHADAVDIEQLILSLIIRIMRAHPGRGKLTVSTATTEKSSQTEMPHALKAGTYTMFSLRFEEKNLSGQMDRSNAAKLADLQTPEALGLTSVSTFAKRAGAVVDISPSAAETISWNVYFPALPREPGRVTENKTGKEKPQPYNTILVVEDDDAVRVPAAEFLKMNGLKVLQAKDGPEALRILERHQGSLDLLVTDILMPGMTGSELAKKLKTNHPDLKVLYMSGDSERIPGLETEKLTGSMLQKPVRLDTLNRKICEVLGQNEDF